MSDGHTDRTGLYIMVICILLSTCSQETKQEHIHKHLQAIESHLGIVTSEEEEE